MQKINLFLLLSVALLLASCSIFRSRQEIDPTNLNSLQNAYQDITPDGSLRGTGLSQIRNKVIEDTAMGLGAQAGLAYASKEMNARLEKDKWYLETTYNFNGMMLSHGVIPPVLQQGDFALNLADPNTIRVADKTYRILQQARFATTPPNWRDYLWMAYNKPELPNRVMLPKTAEESRAWRKAIKMGWDRGIQQASSIFQQNLARLKRDYQGMALYRKLLEQKMISAPYVSRTELGVTGDGNDMRVNDQVLRITELPQLQTESKGWRAIVVQKYDD
jgi:defect-in-organelle-trafficking protein DotC